MLQLESFKLKYFIAPKSSSESIMNLRFLALFLLVFSHACAQQTEDKVDSFQKDISAIFTQATLDEFDYDTALISSETLLRYFEYHTGLLLDYKIDSLKLQRNQVHFLLQTGNIQKEIALAYTNRKISVTATDFELLFSNEPSVLFSQGYSFMKKGQPDKAIYWFKLAAVYGDELTKWSSLDYIAETELASNNGIFRSQYEWIYDSLGTWISQKKMVHVEKYNRYFALDPNRVKTIIQNNVNLKEDIYLCYNINEFLDEAAGHAESFSTLKFDSLMLVFLKQKALENQDECALSRIAVFYNNIAVLEEVNERFKGNNEQYLDSAIRYVSAIDLSENHDKMAFLSRLMTYKARLSNDSSLYMKGVNWLIKAEDQAKINKSRRPFCADFKKILDYADSCNCQFLTPLQKERLEIRLKNCIR